MQILRYESHVCRKRVENEVTSKRQVKSEHDSERNTCAIGGETVKYSSTLEKHVEGRYDDRKCQEWVEC